MPSYPAHPPVQWKGWGKAFPSLGGRGAYCGVGGEVACTQLDGGGEKSASASRDAGLAGWRGVWFPINQEPKPFAAFWPDASMQYDYYQVVVSLPPLNSRLYSFLGPKSIALQLL